MDSLGLLLIDDHAMFRSGMAMVLRSGLPELAVFEAGSLDEAMHQPMPAPAVVLLDIHLQGLSGLECIAVLRQRWPRAAIIMLSSDATPTTVSVALQRGAVAFVSKSDTASNMVALIKQVLGQAPDALGAHAAPAKASICGDVCQRPVLTPRQSEVLDLLCQGLPNKTIGKRLGISENTVRGHVQALLALLQAAGRSEAVFSARQLGLVR